MLKSLFNKITCLQACNFIKKRLQLSCFPVNIAKLLRTVFFYRTPVVAGSEVLVDFIFLCNYLRRTSCFLSNETPSIRIRYIKQLRIIIAPQLADRCNQLSY